MRLPAGCCKAGASKPCEALTPELLLASKALGRYGQNPIQCIHWEWRHRLHPTTKLSARDLIKAVRFPSLSISGVHGLCPHTKPSMHHVHLTISKYCHSMGPNNVRLLMQFDETNR